MEDVNVAVARKVTMIYLEKAQKVCERILGGDLSGAAKLEIDLDRHVLGYRSIVSTKSDRVFYIP